MEQPFTKVVTQIFNNWTALRLAVQHSMGGPNSKQVAIDFVNYMVQYCLYEQVEVEGIQNALEDIMDEEFETICEDESPRQIAQLLYKFLNLLREGKNEECESEFHKLPTVNIEWLNQQSHAEHSFKAQDYSSEDSNNQTKPETTAEQETPMEQDSWTEVKSKRKR